MMKKIWAMLICIDGVKCDDYDEVSRYGFRDLIASPGGPCISIAQVRNHVESIGISRIQGCWSKFFVISCRQALVMALVVFNHELAPSFNKWRHLRLFKISKI